MSRFIVLLGLLFLMEAAPAKADNDELSLRADLSRSVLDLKSYNTTHLLFRELQIARATCESQLRLRVPPLACFEELRIRNLIQRAPQAGFRKAISVLEENCSLVATNLKHLDDLPRDRCDPKTSPRCCEALEQRRVALEYAAAPHHLMGILDSFNRDESGTHAVSQKRHPKSKEGPRENWRP